MTMQERAREWLQDWYGAGLEANEPELYADQQASLATLLTTIRAEALEEAAREVDCGGPSSSCGQHIGLLKDGKCIRSASRDCEHDKANAIRSLIPQERT